MCKALCQFMAIFHHDSLSDKAVLGKHQHTSLAFNVSRHEATEHMQDE